MLNPSVEFQFRIVQVRARAVMRALAMAACAALFLAGCTSNGLLTPGGGQTPERIETPLPGQSGEVPPGEPGPGAPPALPPEPGSAAPMSDQPPSLVPPVIDDGLTRVAILLPLSGRHAAVGRSLMNAAMLAVFEVAGGSFRLLPVDTRGTPEGARRAAETAVAGGARLIVGPLFSGSVEAVAPVARGAGINVIAFSNNRNVAGTGVYLMGLLPQSQIQRIASYAMGRGLWRFGALVPSGEFGEQVLTAFRDAIVAGDGELVRAEIFTDAEGDLARAVRSIGDFDRRKAELEQQIAALEGRSDEVSRRTLERLRRLETLGEVGFEALLVAASGDQLTEVAAQLGNYDIDTKRLQLLGLSSWEEPGTGREPALQGAWFATPPASTSEAFRRSYRAMFETDAHLLGSSAYDAVALAAILAEGPEGPRYDTASLTNESGFAGISGLFRLLPSGLSERGLEVRRLTERGNTRIDPAPRSFQPLTN